MKYKGFEFNSCGQSRNERMKGATVRLYNNHNGTYGSIEYGKDFTGLNRIAVSDEVEELIIKTAVDKALLTGEICEKEHVNIKFSSDFLLGVIATVATVALLNQTS